MEVIDAKVKVMRLKRVEGEMRNRKEILMMSLLNKHWEEIDGKKTKGERRKNGRGLDLVKKDRG